MDSSASAPITTATVALTVANLDASLAFYQQRVGLRLHRRDGGAAFLGAGGPDLLRLTEKRGARKAPRTAGLYHFALLLPTRFDLALTLRHFAESQTMLSGLSDHAVSEAIYLADPDGHGIEIYCDRPRDAWEYPNGRLKLVTEPFDVQSVFNELQGSSQRWHGLPDGTVMGHVHLHVSHLDAAETFYRTVIGLDLVTRYGGSASFLSSGGYHHHLGINVWNGTGALPQPADALGLEWFTLQAAPALLSEIQTRLDKTAVPYTQSPVGLHLADPAGNPIRLIPQPNS